MVWDDYSFKDFMENYEIVNLSLFNIFVFLN